MKDDFKKIAQRFVEYLKADDFEKAFQFVLNDGSCDFEFGTVYVGEFDNLIFVTSMYGDGAWDGTQSLLKFDEDANRTSEDWDDLLDTITDYYYENYKNWNVVE